MRAERTRRKLGRGRGITIAVAALLIGVAVPMTAGAAPPLAVEEGPLTLERGETLASDRSIPSAPPLGVAVPGRGPSAGSAELTSVRTTETLTAALQPGGVVAVRVSKLDDYCENPGDLVESLLCRVL